MRSGPEGIGLLFFGCVFAALCVGIFLTYNRNSPPEFTYIRNCPPGSVDDIERLTKACVGNGTTEDHAKCLEEAHNVVCPARRVCERNCEGI